MISITGLKKSFGSHTVLQGIDLEIKAGTVCGIAGENGAGKTTLFRCISGLDYHEGKVESPFSPLKNHLGFLQTESYFFPKTTGREYIRYCLQARGIKTENLNNKNIFELPLDSYAENYSTGMKKKLALMAVLLQKNDVLILDEPFNGVDIQSNIIITEIIKKLKEQGKTILISSHIYSTLTDTCDEIHLLREGKLVKRVEREQFKDLENEMKRVTLGKNLHHFFE